MISKPIAELQSQIRQYQVAVGLILSSMFFGTGGGLMSALKTNKLNLDIITSGLIACLFFANLYARRLTVVRAIHVMRDGPTSINKLRALQQAPPNDETKTMADAIIKDYFTEEKVKEFLKP